MPENMGSPKKVQESENVVYLHWFPRYARRNPHWQWRAEICTGTYVGVSGGSLQRAIPIAPVFKANIYSSIIRM